MGVASSDPLGLSFGFIAAMGLGGVRKSWRLGLFVVYSLVLVSCGNGSLSLSEWELLWRDTVEQITELETQGITPSQCQETLGYLRVQRPALSPPPLEDLEDPLDSWFGLAEDAFFECRFGSETDKDRTFDTLRTYVAEVETVLTLEG